MYTCENGFARKRNIDFNGYNVSSDWKVTNPRGSAKAVPQCTGTPIGPPVDKLSTLKVILYSRCLSVEWGPQEIETETTRERDKEKRGLTGIF